MPVLPTEQHYSGAADPSEAVEMCQSRQFAQLVLLESSQLDLIIRSLSAIYVDVLAQAIKHSTWVCGQVSKQFQRHHFEEQ